MREEKILINIRGVVWVTVEATASLEVPSAPEATGARPYLVYKRQAGLRETEQRGRMSVKPEN